MADPKISQNPSTLRSLYEGAVVGDFSDNNSGTKAGAQIFTGLVPVVGQLGDARDTFAAIRDVKDGKSGGWGNLAFAAIGWVPLAGDFIKSVRKIGLSETVSGIKNSFSAIGRDWNLISKNSDIKAGDTSGIFYKPATDLEADDLPFGTLGTTNRYGDIKVEAELPPKEKLMTLDHEKVHAFLSPKLNFMQDFRAKVGLLGYSQSHLLRRVEEGLADAWSQFKSRGLSGIKDGWNFPYTSKGYGINPERVKTEAKILLGATTTASAIGWELGSRLNDQPIVEASELSKD